MIQDSCTINVGKVCGKKLYIVYVLLIKE